MHRSLRSAAFAAAALALSPLAAHAYCDDPDALGTYRTLRVDTSQGLEVGHFQYRGSLGLAENEVVLTFDDGPFPGTTDRILDTLARACARATFFVVGRMAVAHGGLARREVAEGHTVGTHSLGHPLDLNAWSFGSARREIDRGIAYVERALGAPPAPFFRFPGLAHTRSLRSDLKQRGIGVFSADAMGYDWTPISGDSIRRRVLRELAANHGGIILLHDTKRATAAMLPQLLKDLKAGGYRLVHIVPGSPLIASYGDDDGEIVTGTARRMRQRGSAPAEAAAVVPAPVDDATAAALAAYRKRIEDNSD